MRRSRLGEVCAGVDAASQRITTTWLNIFVGALFEPLVAISELSGKVPILAWPRLGWAHAYFSRGITVSPKFTISLKFRQNTCLPSHHQMPNVPSA